MFKKKVPQYASEDFLEDLLPRNRKEQFKFIFKTRKSLLVLLSILSLLCASPLILALGFKDAYVYNFFLLYEAGKLTQEGYVLMTLMNNMIFTAICCGCLLVYSIFLAGLFNVLKKLIFGDPVFFKYDFFHGIKLNWLPFLIMTFILSIFLTVLSVIFRFLLLDAVYIVAVIIVVLFVYPFFAGLYFYKSVYSCSFKENFYNGMYILRVGGFKGLGLLLGLIIIPVTSNILAEFLMITTVVNLIINIIYFLIILPVYLLLLYCFFYSIFDVRLNKVLFTDYYMRGLYKPDISEVELHDENKDKK